MIVDVPWACKSSLVDCCWQALGGMAVIEDEQTYDVLETAITLIDWQLLLYPDMAVQHYVASLPHAVQSAALQAVSTPALCIEFC